MKRPGRVLRFAAPLRVMAQRFTFLGLLALSVGLMVLGKAEMPIIEQVRTMVADAFVPLLDALSRPVATVAEMGQKAAAMMNVYSENRRLREENDRLLRWETVARNLETENRSLRDVLRLAPESSASYVTAPVVGDAAGMVVRSVLVTARARDGAAKGQTAITGDGLVGRVGEVGERSARILLLTDLNSQVPVLIENSRARAILAGDNSDQPKLTFLPSDVRPQAGDRIVTSGHAGVFPPGLPVRTLTSPTHPPLPLKTSPPFYPLLS